MEILHRTILIVIPFFGSRGDGGGDGRTQNNQVNFPSLSPTCIKWHKCQGINMHENAFEKGQCPCVWPYLYTETNKTALLSGSSTESGLI